MVISRSQAISTLITYEKLDPPLPAILVRWPYAQEEVSPWRLLAGCILLDGAQPELVDQVWPLFFWRWPDLDTCLSSYRRSRDSQCSATAQRELLATYGLDGRKVGDIHRLAKMWREVCGDGNPQPDIKKIAEFRGCESAYAHDAYLLFACICDEIGAVIEDPALRAWRDQALAYNWRFEEETAIVERVLESRMPPKVFEAKGLRTAFTGYRLSRQLRPPELSYCDGA